MLSNRFLIQLCFFAFLPMVFFAACKKCPTYLSYKIPASLYPAQDSFNLGDTLWLTLNFPEKMLDENQQIENTFSQFDFKIQLSCEYLDSVPSQAQTTDYLDLQTTVGQDSLVALPSAKLTFYKLTPDYANATYRYECALVIRKKGRFVLFLFPFDHQSDPFEFNGNCDKLALHFTSRLNNDADNNYSAFSQLQHPSYSAWNAERFHNNGGYYFVVR